MKPSQPMAIQSRRATGAAPRDAHQAIATKNGAE